MKTPLFLRLFGPNVLHHHWGPQMHVLFHAHFNTLFYSAHHTTFVLVSALQKIQNETYIKMRSVTTRRFKKSATLKKEDLISSKIGHYRVNLISIIEFVSSVSYIYILLPNTHFLFLIACICDATCHFCNCACYCTKDNTLRTSNHRQLRDLRSGGYIF